MHAIFVCISVTFMFVVPGGRRDKVSVENVREALGQIDSSYRAHSQAALQAVQAKLKATFGFNVVLTRNPDSVYVVNAIRYGQCYNMPPVTCPNVVNLIITRYPTGVRLCIAY